ncbi:MAG: hemerythrin domain-containing protein [Prolixibacteraceae bacterium]
MNIFSPQDKMVSLVRHNYNLLPVLNRFGIRLGFKDKTVAEICTEKNVDINFFLAIVNTYHNEDYFPQQELLSFSPLLIIRYLKETHQYYLNYVLPKLEKQLDTLISGCNEQCEELNTIDAFYKRYKKELLNHLDEEEEKVFPYVEALFIQSGFEKYNYKIKEFEKEHTNVEEQLNDLKNLLLKYLNPVYQDNDCNEFLTTLFNFEKDITDHARIEDAILMVQVEKMEKETGR